jgi:2-polyprenyl-6-methoxyphenol hydroxylase-like FAD-dependent oxidoreductase
MPQTSFNTNCCISGGGPAGMMVAFLLARAGIDVIVLEKHADFFRDFRGDTLHPSTFELMHELGILDEFLKLPHQEVTELAAFFNGRPYKLADFSRLKTTKPALGLMPQWDFLNFLKKESASLPSFHLMMNTHAIDLVFEKDQVTGVVAQTENGQISIHAKLVIVAEGRHSVLREKAGLPVINYGSPIDVLWFRLSKDKRDPAQTGGFFNAGKFLVLIDRNDYWQCGYVIPKDTLVKIKETGLSSLTEEIVSAAPFLKTKIHELKDWEQVKLLTVKIDRLKKWYREGFLCIGDAAHAMSPVGGVGINLALQDAVATANILYKALQENKNINAALLKQVQDRREYPTKFTQRMQLAIQNGIISKHLTIKKPVRPPLAIRILNKSKWLRKIPARLIGIGVRPEHIQSPYIKNPL